MLCSQHKQKGMIMQDKESKYCCDILSETQKKQLFKQFYEEVNGYLISSEDKKNHKEVSKSLTYGEVTFEGLNEIFDIINPR